MTAAAWIAENDTFMSRRGHRIAFRRTGSGPTVLLLRGFPTWSYDYAEVADDLAADHDVITMDFSATAHRTSHAAVSSPFDSEVIAASHRMPSQISRSEVLKRELPAS